MMNDGASASQTNHRYWVVVGAVLIQLCLGSLYAWSAFTVTLREPPYDFNETQIQWIFSVELVTFAVVMIVAGRLMKRIAPRLLTSLGGLVLGLGFVAAGFVGDSFLGHLLTIGVVGGTGIGMAYAVPIAVGVKWFPDKKGMLTGLAVTGFGFGALVWVKLAGSWGNLLGVLGLPYTFIVYGIAFAVIVLIGSIWMVNPPADYRPPGWKPGNPGEGAATKVTPDVDSREMLGMWQFSALWLIFVAGSIAGLMVIGCIKLFGIDTLETTGFSRIEASAKAGTAMGVFLALGNGLGRIGWGLISDQLGRKASLALNFFIQGLAMLAFYRMGFHEYLLYAGAAVIGFNYGGNFALFPAITADFFGVKNLGANYAWIFTAYGVGGLVGPVLGGYFKNRAPSGDPSAWLLPLVIAGIACLVAALIALFLKPPKQALP